MKKEIRTIPDDYFEKPYLVIDLLPFQVPADSEGQYFAVEQYYLKTERFDDICRHRTDILLKLNCYYDLAVYEEERWICLFPEELAQRIMEHREDLMILVPSADCLMQVSCDSTYITVYSPSERLASLLETLANAHGMFVFDPAQKNPGSAQ
ncbi:MAG: hypothetical protein K6A40_07970 [Solobacterium sp.]|nr:hypothetical protein [Solobacterium sp.]